MTTSINGTSSVGSASTVSASSSTSGGSASQLTVQDFLSLMTQQLKNQDPMHPTDNAEFFSQIAQFSTVSGISTLNSSVSQLSTQLSSAQSIQAASMVGHKVMVQSNYGYLGSAGMSGAVEVPASGSVTVRITDNTGAVVRTMNLGAHSAGNADFTWDGKTDSGATAASGNYAVSATVNSNGKAQSAATDIQALVQSVDLNSAGSPSLNLEGLGSVALSKVLEVS